MPAEKLNTQLGGHECMTVPEAGLAAKKNGELLALAEQKGGISHSRSRY